MLFGVAQHADYAGRSRAERLIVWARVVVASGHALIVWLSPAYPERHATGVYVCLVAYAAYALTVAAVVWHRPTVPRRLPFVTHALDLAGFPVLMYFASGAGSPFFVYAVFLLLCATLRWQWRGTLWTAAGCIAVFLVMGAHFGQLLREPGYELHVLLPHAYFLVLVTALLGALSVHQERLRWNMYRLAAWPGSFPDDLPGLARDVLERAAHLFRAPRAVLCWEEEEEPWIHSAAWTQGEFQYTRAPPGTWQPLVAPPVASAAFLCNDTRRLTAIVPHLVPEGLRQWRGSPLHQDFHRRFEVHSVLGAELRAPQARGHLLLLDRRGFTTDDLVLARIVGHQAAALMEHLHLLQGQHEVAAAEARVRLARDLHDGLLQSLSAAALQLEAARGLLAQNPDAAAARLAEIQLALAEEHRDLRSFVAGPKSSLPMRTGDSDLALRLAQLAKRATRQWRIGVKLKLHGLSRSVSDGLGHHVHFLVQEAVVNAARHARATAAMVELHLSAGRVLITVTDNGSGFAFRGRYDHGQLAQLGCGPMSLMERVGSLGGTLSIDSTDSGACVQMALPLAVTGG